MRIFEFHFNPNVRRDRFSKVISSDSLLIAGELLNALPSNAKFLEEIAQILLSEYGESSNLKGALRKLNDFLAQEIKKENVDWVGNLHLVVIAFAIKPKTREQVFSLGKYGTIKTLLSRKGNTIDIEKKIESNNRVPAFPAFGNVISSSLAPQDKLMICTRTLFDTLLQENILSDLAFFKEERQYKALFKAKEKNLSKVPGFLVSALIEEIQSKKISKQKAPVHLNLDQAVLKETIPFLLLGFLLLAGFLLFR